MLEFILAKTSEDLSRCLRIRRNVFIIEKGVSETIEIDEYDSVDNGTYHFVVVNDNEDVGAFRIRFNNDSARLQRFCFIKEVRKKGFGSLTLDFIENYCIEKNIHKIEFDAKLESSAFYVKNGYDIVSEEFEEAGIPHVKMEKSL